MRWIAGRRPRLRPGGRGAGHVDDRDQPEELGDHDAAGAGVGLPTRVTDPNSRVTDLAYDALGRLTAVWLPGWGKIAHPTLPSKGFAYTVRNTRRAVRNRDQRAQHRRHRVVDVVRALRWVPASAADAVPAHDGAGNVVTDTYHDSRGLVVKANPAYFTSGFAAGTNLIVTSDASVPAQTRVSFDGAARQSGTRLMSYGVERWHTITAYGGDRVDHTPRVWRHGHVCYR